jgi:hypothetical protein
MISSAARCGGESVSHQHHQVGERAGFKAEQSRTDRSNVVASEGKALFMKGRYERGKNLMRYSP